MSATRFRLAVLLVCSAVAIPAFAAPLTLVTDRSLLPSDDLIMWSDLGGDFTPLGSPFDALSQGGARATVSGADAFTLFSGATYNADFSSTDTVLSLFDLAAGGPVAGQLTLRFDRAVRGAGAQIQSLSFGGFTAYLMALDINGAALGAEVSIAGTNGGNGAGAPFLGVRSDLQDIYGIRFRMDDLNSSGYAVNDVSLSDPAPVPEPGTLGLVMLGAGLLRAARRRARA